MIFGLLFLFGHYGDVPLSTLDDPLLIALLAIGCVVIPVLGNFRPDKISFLPVDALLRRQLGDQPVAVPQGQRRRGEARRARSTSRRRSSVEQLAELYDRETAELLLDKGLAFRSMHSHGRALNGLLPARRRRRRGLRRARGRADRRRRDRLELRRRALPQPAAARGGPGACGFEPGELRVVTLESQPAHMRPPALPDLRRRDRAGRGGLGRGRRHGRAPAWLEESCDFPVEVTREPRSGPAAASSHERGDRRRLRPERAGLRGGARARGRGGDGARGRGDDRRRHPQQRADAARACCTTTARPSTRWRVGSPSFRSLDLERHGLEWRWPEVDLAHPLDDGSAGVMLRSIEDTAPGSAPTGRPGGASSELRRRPSTRSPRTSCARCCTCRGTRCGSPASGSRRRCRPPRWRERWRTPQARALFGGVAAHAFSPLGAADERLGRDGADLRLPPVRLAGGRAAARRRSPTRSLAVLREHGGRIETGRPGALARRSLPRRRRRGPRPGSRARGRDRRRPAAGARRPRLPALPARARRLQGRPRGRGRRAVDQRGLPPRRHRPRRTAPSRRSSPPSATSTAAGCPSGRSCSSASSTSPTRSAPPATSTRSGPTPTSRTATPATPSRPSSTRSSASPRACASGSSARAVRSTAADRRLQRELRRRRHHHRRQHPLAGAHPPPARARPVQHGHPRRLHLLGGDSTRRRRARR